MIEVFKNSEDLFTIAGEEIAIATNKGLSKGVIYLLETAKKMLMVLRTALAGPLTKELTDQIDQQLALIDKMMVDETVYISEMAHFAGKQFGAKLADGLTVSFPKFQRIIGIYLELGKLRNAFTFNPDILQRDENR